MTVTTTNRQVSATRTSLKRDSHSISLFKLSRRLIRYISLTDRWNTDEILTNTCLSR